MLCLSDSDCLYFLFLLPFYMLTYLKTKLSFEPLNTIMFYLVCQVGTYFMYSLLSSYTTDSVRSIRKEVLHPLLSSLSTCAIVLVMANAFLGNGQKARSGRRHFELLHVNAILDTQVCEHCILRTIQLILIWRVTGVLCGIITECTEKWTEISIETHGVSDCVATPGE